MKVVALQLYPIKGLGGITVTTAQTSEEGFVYDRRWMLVDEEGTFLSQRSHPRFALFQQAITPNGLLIKYNDDQLSVPTDQLSEESLEVTLFGQPMRAHEVSSEVSRWFSKQLGQPVKLVGQGKDTRRIKALKKGPAETLVSFADGYPYLILGTESLEELNRRLASPVPMNRFRPNIVVQTQIAHEEDSWEKIQIGDQDLIVIKPCARCEVTTINQESAERGKEPLKTMASYRKVGNKVNFGANAISLSEGMINVGDELKLIQ